MNSKTAELLNLLFWSADKFCRPTFRNLTESYESWRFEKSLPYQITRLKARGLIECDAAAPNDRLYRLTSAGRVQALGGRDPQAQWARAWDGKWRLVIFDVPTARNAIRTRVRRYLQDKHFGFLQNSVWITPDPLDEERDVLAGGAIDVESLILLDARPCSGESDDQIVTGAWNFDDINNRYARHLKILERHPRRALRSEASAADLADWSREEQQAWLEAVTSDPLLPERILPRDYLGQKAWRKRIEVLGRAARQLQTFKL